MKNLEELKKIKERALQRRQLAGVDARARIIVAMGTTGIAAGARDTMAAILAELEKRAIRDVVVTQTGGGGLSTYEPLIQVQIGEDDPVKYGNVDAARAVKIIESHIVNGQPVEEWLVK